MKTKITLLATALVACFKLQAQTPAISFTPVITSGLVSPVHITNCKDDRLFLVEQDGRIRVKHPGVAAMDTFMDINSRVGGGAGSEQGLLSVAFHPNYKQNGYFYVDYTDNNSDTRISRFSVNPADSNKALANSEVILLNIYQPFSNHNGGQLQFGLDGYLYIGMGDGGSANDPGNRAHNKDSLLGKILRIDIDNGPLYSIPLDNPFINTPNARDEIWTIGMRNPWRFSFDRLTGDMWVGDVGQGSWEEVDYQKAGTGGGDDYGWRCWEGTHTNTAVSGCAGIVNQHPPVYEYSHSVGYSITGGYVYRGAKYATLYGHYLFVDYGFTAFQSLKANGSGGFTHYNLATLSSGNGNVSTFGEDMFGELYVSNISSGVIYRIDEANNCPVAAIADSDTLNVCDSVATLSTPLGLNLIYHWTDGSGTAIDTANTTTVSQSGWYQVDVVNAAFCTSTDSVYVNLLGAPPVASFTGLDSLYCVYNAADTLIGIPAGGAFIGAGINSAVFNPDSAGLGIHIVHYNYTDANGCVSTATAVVRVEICVGLAEINGIGVSAVYPNPATDHLQINLDATTAQKAAWFITDVAGRTISEKEVTLAIGKNNVEIAISHLDAGLYLWHLNSQGATLSRKFVVTK